MEFFAVQRQQSANAFYSRVLVNLLAGLQHITLYKCQRHFVVQQQVNVF